MNVVFLAIDDSIANFVCANEDDCMNGAGGVTICLMIERNRITDSQTLGFGPKSKMRCGRALCIAWCVSAANCRINSLFIARIIRLPILALLLVDGDYSEFSCPSFVPHSTHTVYWQRLIFFCHVSASAPICCDVPSLLLRCFFFHGVDFAVRYLLFLLLMLFLLFKDFVLRALHKLLRFPLRLLLLQVPLISQVARHGIGEINVRLFSFRTSVCSHRMPSVDGAFQFLRLPNAPRVHRAFVKNTFDLVELNAGCGIRSRNSEHACVYACGQRRCSVCRAAHELRLIFVRKKLMEFHFTLH